ncbi:hypothetical protein CTAYLR_003770 [Chrysophaeum taylorii]|uniref:Acyltransferase 3 domain-containing protein n=1 Tax=Chrysophaeum taylorii TaxID=2483200 RepID=A0AAD7UET5_9STRA|nr:hypothetical protein CTAYLR_003770 [Chrysophaeum taylorii]
MGGGRRRLESVDGLRALTHLSVIGFHTALVTTALVPSSGGLWDGVRQHPVHTCLVFGGTQVDTMFMLSGLLFKRRGVRDYVATRVARLLPGMIICAALGLALGDDWGGAAAGKVLPYMFFFGNYLDAQKWGSLTMTLAWSNAVDFQVGLVLELLPTPPRESVSYGLIALSLWLRGRLFDVNSINMFLIGEYTHFGRLMSQRTYDWVRDFYDYEWPSSPDPAARSLSAEYVNKMYMRTHTRFGPFVVGTCLAAFLKKSNNNTTTSSAVSTTILRMITTFFAFSILIGPCVPPGDAVPDVGTQFAITAAMRTLSATAAASLLYRALVKADNPWSLPILERFLSAKCWKPVARLSYLSYLIHFRIILELVFRFCKNVALETPGDVARLELCVFAISTLASLSASALLHVWIEAPLQRLIYSLLAPPGGHDTKDFRVCVLKK